MSRSPRHTSTGAAALPNIFVAPQPRPKATPERHGVFDERAACAGERLDGIQPLRDRVRPIVRRGAWAAVAVAALLIAVWLIPTREEPLPSHVVPRLRTEEPPPSDVVPRPRTVEPAVSKPRLAAPVRRERAPRRRETRSQHDGPRPASPRRAPKPTPSANAPAPPPPSPQVPPAPRPLPKRVPSGSPPEFM